MLVSFNTKTELLDGALIVAETLLEIGFAPTGTFLFQDEFQLVTPLFKVETGCASKVIPCPLELAGERFQVIALMPGILAGKH